MRPLTIIALVLCLAGGAQAKSASDVQVLAAHKGWIDDPPGGPAQFGVNGTRLKWHDLTPFTSGKLRTLDVASSRTSVTGRWPAGLAFAGGRIASRTVEGGLSLSNSIGVSDQTGRYAGLEQFDMPHEGPGGYLTDPYAFGPNIAYGWYETRVLKESCDADGFDCDYTIRRGGLRLIDGMKRGRLVTRAPVAVLSLSTAGTAAYVRATSRWHAQRGPSMIEVTTLRSPRVLLRIRAPGHVTALAISDRVLVAGTYHPTRRRRALTFYDLWGRRLRVFRESGVNSIGGLAVKGSRVVLVEASGIVEVEAYSGARRVLVRNGGGDGLAFAGDKLVWYEERGGDDAARYRVLSISLDRG